jgi:hypothetical protein
MAVMAIERLQACAGDPAKANRGPGWTAGGPERTAQFRMPPENCVTPGYFSLAGLHF